MALENYRLLSLVTLGSFDGTNGATPIGSMVLDSQGNLFGVTQFGGANNAGMVFEVPKGSGIPTSVLSFNGTTAAQPSGGLVIDSQGNLYGTTISGSSNVNGSVFEVKSGTTNVITIGTFNGTNGVDPAGLAIDAKGNLYGITTGGGADNDGTVFEIAKGTNTAVALASFSALISSRPRAAWSWTQRVTSTASR